LEDLLLISFQTLAPIFGQVVVDLHPTHEWNVNYRCQIIWFSVACCREWTLLIKLISKNEVTGGKKIGVW